MGVIKVENIRVFAHHGCMGEETIIGGDYRIDLEVEADLSLSSKSDALKDTVDYVLLNAIVKDEMRHPSKLLETVAQRIINRVLDECKTVIEISIAVSKLNPPIEGDVEKVTIVLKQKR
jgi:dihydroneopterin aldolase